MRNNHRQLKFNFLNNFFKNKENLEQLRFDDIRYPNSCDRGKFGESIVLKTYLDLGYILLGQNWHCKYGEIDLIFELKSVLVFVEAKYRSSGLYGSGFEAVNRNKQQRIKKTASLWLIDSGKYYDSLRFDVASIDSHGSVQVIENAF